MTHALSVYDITDIKCWGPTVSLWHQAN